MSCVFAPVPDFRYVGLEPASSRSLGVVGAAIAIGTSVALVTSTIDPRPAGLAGGAASLLAAFVLSAARPEGSRAAQLDGRLRNARMAIVPWGVLVHADEAPRILRWAAVKRLDVATSLAHGVFGATVSSRVVIETERERFAGTTRGTVPLDTLARHLEDYADEQAGPVALDLDGTRAVESLEPACESLFGAARSWLSTAVAAVALDLPPAGYRRAALPSSSPRTVEVLRRVLGDRTPKAADPRAFAAVVAAEVQATDLASDLAALAQCPHPVVAAVAKQAALRLGAPRARVGTLDEVAPFLFEGDRLRLDAWTRS